MYWRKQTTYTVNVAVVTVSVVKAVSTLSKVDVTVSTSVTVVVAGSKANQEEQNDSPNAGSAAIAPKHLLEPHLLVQAALDTPARTPALVKSNQDLISSVQLPEVVRLMLLFENECNCSRRTTKQRAKNE